MDGLQSAVRATICRSIYFGKIVQWVLMPSNYRCTYSNVVEWVENGRAKQKQKKRKLLFLLLLFHFVNLPPILFVALWSVMNVCPCSCHTSDERGKKCCANNTSSIYCPLRIRASLSLSLSRLHSRRNNDQNRVIVKCLSSLCNGFCNLFVKHK